MRTRQTYIKGFHGGASCPYPDFCLPAGLRVKECGNPSGKYWLDEFPEDLFPPNSGILHDAVHYGIVLNRDQVDAGETEVRMLFLSEYHAENFTRFMTDVSNGRCGVRAIYGAIRRVLKDGLLRITKK